MKSFLSKVAALSMEEKILNCNLIIAMSGMFFPWLAGNWLGGESRMYTGFGSYTSFMGITIFCLYAFSFLITCIPMTSNKHLVASHNRNSVRYYCCIGGSALTLCILSVLTKITWDFQGLEVRFGVYITLFGGMVATLYTYLLHQESNKNSASMLFYQHTTEHEEEKQIAEKKVTEASNVVTSKSIPQPPKAEEHSPSFR